MTLLILFCQHYVEEQCVNVIKTAFVQKSYRRRGFPVVHGWV